MPHRAVRDRSLELIPIHPAARIPREFTDRISGQMAGGLKCRTPHSFAVKCPQVDVCIDVLFKLAEDADAEWPDEQFVSIQSKLADLAEKSGRGGRIVRRGTCG